ncbi:hypothetical protein C8J56DRAFT_891124 [Mycena floridula]|nr:hypothetical protein C8J56DRAFT_891124 [Mycena floridula]
MVVKELAQAPQSLGWFWDMISMEPKHDIQRYNGYFNGAIKLHVALFRWLWPQLVQKALDDFVWNWNCHRVRIQRYKKLPSGVFPETVFKFPQNYGLAHGGIKVEQEIVSALRGTIPISRDECMRWVTDEFNVAATAAFKSLKECPPFKAVNGWTIFLLMLDVLSLEM